MKIELVLKANVSFLVTNFLLLTMNPPVIKKVGNESRLNNNHFQEYPSRV